MNEDDPHQIEITVNSELLWVWSCSCRTAGTVYFSLDSAKGAAEHHRDRALRTSGPTSR